MSFHGIQNSDDVYMPGAFRKVQDVFEKFPDKKIVYGNWYEIDENDNVIDKTYSAPKPRIPHFSYEGFDCYNQTMFWRRSVHEKFGFPPENSFAGKYYRVCHRFAKLWWHLTQGGIRYTLHKFWRGYRKRGKIF